MPAQNISSKPIYQMIREARIAVGLSQYEFAKAINQTPQYVRQFEKGKAPYDRGLLEACGNALDLSLDELTDLSLDYRLIVLTAGESEFGHAS